MADPHSITNIKELLGKALLEAEDFRDSIAAEMDEAGENASEEMETHLAEADDILANIQAAVDSVEDSFPNVISSAA